MNVIKNKTPQEGGWFIYKEGAQSPTEFRDASVSSVCTNMHTRPYFFSSLPLFEAVQMREAVQDTTSSTKLLKCEDYTLAHVGKDVCVQRASGHLFQRAMGRVTGGGSGIRGASCHRRVVKLGSEPSTCAHHGGVMPLHYPLLTDTRLCGALA